MSTPSNLPSPHAGGSEPVDLDAALRAAEATLRAGGEPSARALDDLEALKREHPERARKLARRLDTVFATAALRTRKVPAGLLDGLYDDVRAAAESDQRHGRARMSTAFLDAPKSLTVWRRYAVAASVLLAVGVAWTAFREPDETRSRSGVRPLELDDRPYEVLEPFDGGSFTTPAAFDERRRRQPRGMRLPVTIYFKDGSDWQSDPGPARPPVKPVPDRAVSEERN